MSKNTHRIQVSKKQTPFGNGFEPENHYVQVSHQLGIRSMTGCLTSRFYFINGAFTDSELHHIAHHFLVDPVTESYTLNPALTLTANQHLIEVAPLPGVTDSVASNLALRIQEHQIGTLNWISTGESFLISGDIPADDLTQLAQRLFANLTVQHYAIDQPLIPTYLSTVQSDNHVEYIPLKNATDEQLLNISQERRLALDLAEMQAIRAYYQQEDRDPSDLELEMLAQTWSEHCIHKTFRANIRFQQGDQQQRIEGLLKTYIRGATDQLDKPWLRSVFVDNAGIIRFDDHYDLAFKVETHNHPSAIEPFGGANTGVGGVVRDILGVSAKPIANTDVLCFGYADTPLNKIPQGTLHPGQIATGVIHGIEDYGNKMGIPTVNGAVLYDQGYIANPLVFCGCLGILPHGSHPTQAQAGDYIIVIGGRTGRDGLRGATFSSMEMDATTGSVAGSSVQIGNPITEKQVQEVIIRARDEKLYSAITDCGAGGLSSAVGEMAEHIGARIQLDTVPLKYPGLKPWEIWLSEAQERMVLALPPANWPRLQEICAGQDVEAVQIGVFESGGRLHIFDEERLVGDLSMHFLHNGIPTRELEAYWEKPVSTAAITHTPDSTSLSQHWLTLLAHPNIRNKEHVVRRFDHEVQGATSVKPFTGPNESGHNDAAVLIPFPADEQARGLSLSNGICPQYTALDPYAMAWAAIDEAVRNAVSVGTDPDQIAILDNFCWGNPNRPDRLGSLVRTVQGCYDAALAYGTPFISGKDSLNNEYTDSDGVRHAIPGTLLISALGIVPDATRTVSSDLKQAGNLLYLIGDTRHELGASHYAMIAGLNFNQVPMPADEPLQRMRAIHQAMRLGLIQSSHDLSEGGLAIALAEMCLGGQLAASIDLNCIPCDPDLPDYARLFSESLSRFLLEVHPDDSAAFETLMAAVPFAKIGQVQASHQLSIQLKTDLLHINLDEMSQAWLGKPLDQNRLSKFNETIQQIAIHTNKPSVLILHANGTNRDHDVALACQLAGAEPEIVHMNQLRNGERDFKNYAMLVIPGGFSYGDDLGAGRLWALDLRQHFSAQLDSFVNSGRPVLGICNGFQTLVKSGLLPGEGFENQVTLTHNQAGQFECRWVYLKINPRSPNLFTQGLSDLIYCPVAHGEGRLMTANPAVLQALQAAALDTLTYVNADGSNSASYPANPNGSLANIAALSNAAGNVLGLMPHPENHIFPWQHPHYHRGVPANTGLNLFINGVKNT